MPYIPSNEDEFEDDDLLEEEPAEDDIPEELQAVIDRRVKEQTNQFKAQYGGRLSSGLQALRNSGFDITDEGLTIVDPAKASRLLGAPQSPQQGAAPAAAADEDEDLSTIPDPQYQAEEFAAWVEKKTRAATRARDAELQDLRSEMEQDRMGAAIERAREVLPSYGLGDLTDHPDFEQAFEEGLRQLRIPMKDWRNPVMLARVAGIINADLRQSQPRRAIDDLLPDEEAPRRSASTAGRARPDRAAPDVRREISRQQLRETGPSRGSRGGAPEDGYSAVDRQTAKMLGISLQEARALGDQTGRSYDKEAARRKR